MYEEGVCEIAAEESKKEKKEGEKEVTLTIDEIDMLVDAADNQASYFEDNGYRYEHFSKSEKDKEYGRLQLEKAKILRRAMKKLVKGMVKE